MPTTARQRNPARSKRCSAFSGRDEVIHRDDLVPDLVQRTMQVLQQPSLRRNRALLATVALSFVMLLGSAALTFHISRQGMQADALVVHTLEVQRALNETLLTLGGAESGLRGFLLTGNEPFYSLIARPARRCPAVRDSAHIDRRQSNATSDRRVVAVR